MSTVDDPTVTALTFDCPEPKLFSSVSNLLTSSTLNFWHQDGFNLDIVGDLHTMSIQTSDSNLVGDYQINSSLGLRHYSKTYYYVPVQIIDVPVVIPVCDSSVLYLAEPIPDVQYSITSE